MKITYGHMEVASRKAIEQDLTHGVEKLEKLLKRYAPDLVQLHSAMEQIERTGQFSFSLNLTLPTGTLHAVSTRDDLRGTVKVTFAELCEQVKKHQSRLRKDYVWKRKRGRGFVKISESPA